MENPKKNTTELYDAITENWTKTASMNMGRFCHTATLLMNGRVLVAGGTIDFSITIASAELYNPSTDTWTMTGSMQNRRYYHTASLLPDGKVLVTGGGQDTYGILKSAELYNSHGIKNP